MYREGNRGPERRELSLREVGAQWRELIDPSYTTCLHDMSQKGTATVKLAFPFLVASSQNAKIITWPSSSACLPGRHSNSWQRK